MQFVNPPIICADFTNHFYLAHHGGQSQSMKNYTYITVNTIVHAF